MQILITLDLFKSVHEIYVNNEDIISLYKSENAIDTKEYTAWLIGEKDLPLNVLVIVSLSVFVLFADAVDNALIVLVIITVTLELPSLPLLLPNTSEIAWYANINNNKRY